MNIMKLTSPMTTAFKASFCKTIIGLTINIVKVPLECNIPYIKVDKHYFKRRQARYFVASKVSYVI